MKKLINLIKSILWCILFYNVFGSFIHIPLLLSNQYFLFYMFFIELSILGTVHALIAYIMRIDFHVKFN